MSEERNESSRPSAGVARAAAPVIIVAAILLTLWLLSDIVLLIFMAILIAVMLRGTGDWAARHTGASRNLMLALVSVTVVAIIVGMLYYIGPKLANQSAALWVQVQQQLDYLRQAYGSTPWGHALLVNIEPSSLLSNHLASYAGVVATSTLGGLATAFVLIVTALYFAIAPDLYINGVVRLFPLDLRPRARDVLLDIGKTLRSWSLGQLIDMTLVGVLTGIGLALLGVPLPLALGVLAGVLTFIPYFGAIVAAIPAMLVAFTIGWQTSLWTLLVFLVCHSIDGYLVGPLVQRNTADLPPALTILAMTILGSLFGALGIILGAPIAAALLVTVRKVYIGDVLGDPDGADQTGPHAEPRARSPGHVTA